MLIDEALHATNNNAVLEKMAEYVNLASQYEPTVSLKYYEHNRALMQITLKGQDKNWRAFIREDGFIDYSEENCSTNHVEEWYASSTGHFISGIDDKIEIYKNGLRSSH